MSDETPDDKGSSQLIKLEGIVSGLKESSDRTSSEIKELASKHQDLEVNHGKGMTTVSKGFEYLGEKVESLILRHDAADKARSSEISKLTDGIKTLAESMTKIGELERKGDELTNRLENTRELHFTACAAATAEITELKKNLALEEERRKNADNNLRQAIVDKHDIVAKDVKEKHEAVDKDLKEKNDAITKAIEKHEKNNKEEFVTINASLNALNKLRWAIIAIPVLLAAVIAILTIIAYAKGIAVAKP